VIRRRVIDRVAERSSGVHALICDHLPPLLRLVFVRSCCCFAFVLFKLTYCCVVSRFSVPGFWLDGCMWTGSRREMMKVSETNPQ